MYYSQRLFLNRLIPIGFRPGECPAERSIMAKFYSVDLSTDELSFEELTPREGVDLMHALALDPEVEEYTLHDFNQEMYPSGPDEVRTWDFV